MFHLGITSEKVIVAVLKHISESKFQLEWRGSMVIHGVGEIMFPIQY